LILFIVDADLKIMNKGIIIGIAIVAIIGIGVIAVSSNSQNNVTEISPDEDIKNEPKQFTVGLDESVGVSGG